MTTSPDGFVPDRSGDLTAMLPDLIALRGDGLVEGASIALTGTGEFTPDIAPPREH